MLVSMPVHKTTKKQGPSKGGDANSNLRISRIQVRDLFGQYSYDLHPKPFSSKRYSDQLFILYGDNGAGKTTILRLTFHLLSHLDSRGHKTEIAKIKFREFGVELNNGTQVWIRRPSASFGSFHGEIIRHGKRISEAEFKADEQNIVVSTGEEPELKHKEFFFKKLAELRCTLFYLSDQRRLITTRDGQPDLSIDELTGQKSEKAMYAADWVRLVSKISKEDKQSSLSALEESIDGLRSWAKDRVLDASSRGEVDVNSIYIAVAKALAEKNLKPEGAKDVKDLIATLSEQAERLDRFKEFGLAAELATVPLIEALRTSGFKTPELVKAIRPYVDGIKARLDALQEVYTRIQGLQNALRGFMVNKVINFDVTTGLSIKTKDGTLIQPEMLSSGERQVVLLLSTICTTREDRYNFVFIDEPEMSLNIKWQRALLRRLLDLSPNTQFILATHSFELLTPYGDSVVKLSDV
jgi:energy-coupling factor transporter ATP-binding protein EcfA2